MVNEFGRLAVTGNSFLDSLPATSGTSLLPLLSKVSLKKGRVLAHPDTLVEEVFFPVNSLISTLTTMAGGSAVEVGLAGHEGLSALCLAFGSRQSPHTTVVQIADSAYCMSAEAFLRHLAGDDYLQRRMLSYTEYSFNAATQFVACNGLHPVHERYARWMLMAADRTGTSTFALTQEYAAQMLGVRRATVTHVAGVLSSAGLIEHGRGRIEILDREGLEEYACECYATVNAELERAMGYGARQRSLADLATIEAPERGPRSR